MNGSTANLCAICGEDRSGNETRFLLAENRWEDKLTILQWNEPMAARYGIQVACSVSHVEELVIHWMTTGSLDYPFARTRLGAGARREATSPDPRGYQRGPANRRIGGTPGEYGTCPRGEPTISEGHLGCAAGCFAAGDQQSGRGNFRARTRNVYGFFGAGTMRHA